MSTQGRFGLRCPPSHRQGVPGDRWSRQWKARGSTPSPARGFPATSRFRCARAARGGRDGDAPRVWSGRWLPGSGGGPCAPGTAPRVQARVQALVSAARGRPGPEPRGRRGGSRGGVGGTPGTSRRCPRPRPAPRHRVERTRAPRAASPPREPETPRALRAPRPHPRDHRVSVTQFSAAFCVPREPRAVRGASASAPGAAGPGGGVGGTGHGSPVPPAPPRARAPPGRCWRSVTSDLRAPLRAPAAPFSAVPSGLCHCLLAPGSELVGREGATFQTWKLAKWGCRGTAPARLCCSGVCRAGQRSGAFGGALPPRHTPVVPPRPLAEGPWAGPPLPNGDHNSTCLKKTVNEGGVLAPGPRELKQEPRSVAPAVNKNWGPRARPRGRREVLTAAAGPDPSETSGVRRVHGWRSGRRPVGGPRRREGDPPPLRTAGHQGSGPVVYGLFISMCPTALTGSCVK